MRTIDLNADLGEGFPIDRELLDVVTSASISCGAHAGDSQTIAATLRGASERGVAVGAHPGYADRDGFGRSEQSLTRDEVRTLILDQYAALERVAAEVGITLDFVKPHGALYNQAQREEPIARGVVDAVTALNRPLLGQPGSLLQTLAIEAGVRFVGEGFPDRRYEPDGRLVPRTRADALLMTPEEVEQQVLRLLAQGFETLCIHGDDPRAVENAASVRAILRQHGIAPRFWGRGSS